MLLQSSLNSQYLPSGTSKKIHFKMKIFFVVLLSALCVAQVLTVPVGLTQSTRTTDFSLSNSIATFNTKLYEKISQTENGNIFYSPFSLHLVLSQTFLGSGINSSTHRELAKLLDLNDEDKTDYLNQYLFARHSQEAQISQLHNKSIVRIANKAFAAEDITLKDKFRQSMEKFFLATIEQVNFEHGSETAETINNFVKKETGGLIKKLFEAGDIDGATRLILVNAIYFKGEWQHQFNKSDTRNMTFHLDNSTQTQYSAMSLKKKLRTQHIPELGASLLELPYNNNRTSLLVVLPNKNVPIQEVERKLKNYKVTSLYQNIADTVEYDVVVVLPKFETSFEANNLVEIFKSLGVEKLFNDGEADLSSIADESLSVTDIVHKAVIKLDEEGSEAAAVSGIQIGYRSGPELFNVDRPFIFYIYDRPTNLTLFVGRIVDPNGELRLKHSQGLQVKPVEVVGVKPDEVFTVKPVKVVDVKPVEVFDFRANGIEDQPCSELGYQISSPHPKSIRLPCLGHDTITLEAIQDQQDSIREERLAHFNSKKFTNKQIES